MGHFSSFQSTETQSGWGCFFWYNGRFETLPEFKPDEVSASFYETGYLFDESLNILSVCITLMITSPGCLQPV